jgi:hypothetical protein
MRSLLLLASIALLSCSKKPDAMTVCKKLGDAGAADPSTCKAEASNGGLAAAALERVIFDIPGGKPGQVVTFDKTSDYRATVAAFDAAASLAGRHRYGSESALVFVQLNFAADPAAAAKAKAVVDSL